MPLAKKILMGQKELARMSAMEKVKEGNMSLTEAAGKLPAGEADRENIPRKGGVWTGPRQPGKRLKQQGGGENKNAGSCGVP
jgi:hypothetical protein